MPYTLESIKADAINTQCTDYVVLNNGGRWCAPILLEFSSPTDKAKKLNILRDMVKKAGVVEAWLINEAWMVKTTETPSRSLEDARAALPRNLADAPGRIDALFCQYENADGLQMWRFEIKRGESGQIVGLEDLPGGPVAELSCNTWLLEDPNARRARH